MGGQRERERESESSNKKKSKNHCWQMGAEKDREIAQIGKNKLKDELRLIWNKENNEILDSF